tara:strand:- start:28266 stop:30500 length:2235 start_codon:yes stop_codon:yes gene_type:complete
METEQEKVKIGVDRLAGDGSAADPTKAELTNLKNEMDQIMQDAAYDVNARRSDANDARYCRWPGQSSDGLVHSADLDGKEAFPFEGAPDSRIRTADMLVNERAKILVAAATRAQVTVKGTESRDMRLGAYLTIVLRWVLENQLGSSWRRTLERMAQYQEGDVPAGALMGIYWNREVALERATLGLEEVLEFYMASARVEEGAEVEGYAEEFIGLFQDKEGDNRVADIIMGGLPHLKRRTAKRMAKELRENMVVVDGVPSTEAEYPRPYVRKNGLKLTTHRMFEDVFFSSNVHDIQRARVIYVREWLTEVELRERTFTHDYSEKYVEEVLKHEGETGFPNYEYSDFVDNQLVIKTPDDRARRGLFEQVTAYHRASNDDGIPGVYYTCFHVNVDEAAKPRQLLPYAHGDYPFVWFGRETLTSRLWDSRSVPELSMSMQKLQKIFWDSYGAHVQLTTVPPVKVPKSRPNEGMALGPLKQIKEGRPGEIEFMNPPAYPNANDKARVDVERMIDTYFGRFSDSVPPAITQLHVQDMADRFLASLKDTFLMALQLIQQYMDQETITRITGSKEGIPMANSTAEIQGKFDLQVVFDAKDLDAEQVIKKAEVIGKYILPMDTLGTAQRDQIVSRLFAGIDPNMADDVLQPVEAASAKEVDDEMKNFALIAAGVEPPMQPEGQNYDLRAKVLNGIAEQNPAAVERLSEDSVAILQARLKHLGHMVQQRENAQIGRVGARPGLDNQSTGQQGGY